MNVPATPFVGGYCTFKMISEQAFVLHTAIVDLILV